jgi:hypothetical protein
MIPRSQHTNWSVCCQFVRKRGGAPLWNAFLDELDFPAAVRIHDYADALSLAQLLPLPYGRVITSR